MGLDMMLYSMPKIEGLRFSDVLAADHTLMEHYKTMDDVLDSDDETIQFLTPFVKEQGEYIHWLSVKEEVMYWRKANHIHDWFVRNVQDNEDNCEYYPVSREDVEVLLDSCLEVLEYDEDESVAEALLPTTSGFFFGSTDYDEWYYSDTKETANKMQELLNNFDFENNYLVYSSSW